MIGTGETGAQLTTAYIDNSDVIASGDITINASASETIEADVFAGSVAIAAGIGGAIAGAGAELSNSVSSDVSAFVLNSDLAAIGDIDVIALSSTGIDKAQSLGVAIAASLGAASVAVSLVDNTIANDVDAFIDSTGVGNSIMADGNLTVLADVTDARIVAAAETASVSAGLVGLSGGGINITNLVSNTVNADLKGNLVVEILGDIEVKADENAYLSAEALSLAASFSLGAAVGASVVRNTADSDIEATLPMPTLQVTAILMCSRIRFSISTIPIPPVFRARWSALPSTRPQPWRKIPSRRESGARISMPRPVP